MALIALLSWRLLGPIPASIGSALLALDPYVVGMTRLLHVDALLAPLMAISALAGLIYWTRSRRWPYLALSAASGGLALLTKAPAGYLPIFFGLVGVVVGVRSLVRARRASAGAAPELAHHWLRTVPSAVLSPIVLWAATAMLAYASLFPALWVAPAQVVRALIAFLVQIGLEPHPTNFFLGQVTRDDPGPLYYPIVLTLRASPLAVLGLAGLVSTSAEGERRWSSRWLVLYAALFAALMTLGAKKLDRYMLPSLLILDLLAGIGLWRLATHLSRAIASDSARKRFDQLATRPDGLIAGRVAAGLIVACLLGQAALLLLARPYPIAFYNPLAGGPRRAEHLIMIGWGEGLEQVNAFLNGQPNAPSLRVATNYVHVVQPRFVGTSIPVNLYFFEGEGAPLPTPDYVVLYVNSVQRRQIPPLAQRAIQAGPPAFVARVEDVEYGWVYAVPASEPRVDAPVPGGIDAEPEDR
jgi:hypothetical protein